MPAHIIAAFALGGFYWIKDMVTPDPVVKTVSEVVSVPTEEEYLNWIKEQPLRSYMFTTSFVCPFDPGNSVYVPLDENGDNVEYDSLSTHTPVCDKAYNVWLSNRQTIVCTDHPQFCIYSANYSTENNYSNGTATCRDGTISYSRHRQGTCSWHGGVEFWH